MTSCVMLLIQLMVRVSCLISKYFIYHYFAKMKRYKPISLLNIDYMSTLYFKRHGNSTWNGYFKDNWHRSNFYYLRVLVGCFGFNGPLKQ